MLHRAIIFVKDIERMRSFYERALGLRVENERSSESWIEFAGEGASLALHAIPEEIARDIVVASPPRARSETAIKLTFDVTDLAAARAAIADAGGVVLENDDALDPEGNVFRIVAG